MAIAQMGLGPETESTEQHVLVQEFYDFVDYPVGGFNAEFSLSSSDADKFTAADHETFKERLGLTDAFGITPQPLLTVGYITLYGRRHRDHMGRETAMYATYNWGKLQNVPRLLRPAAMAITATAEA